MASLKVTPKLIEEMNELYLLLKTYAGVSRALGGSPSPTTVKKYIIPNYTSQKNLVKKKFLIDDVPKFSPERFSGVVNWGDLCVLSEEEKADIESLWDELTV